MCQVRRCMASMRGLNVAMSTVHLRAIGTQPTLTWLLPGFSGSSVLEPVVNL